MRLNLDELVSKFDPWDFTIALKGTDYATRPLDVADLAALGNVRAMTNIEATKLIENLFVDPKPNLSAAGLEYLSGVTSAITAYFKSRSEKNSLAIGGMVKLQMAIPKAP